MVQNFPEYLGKVYQLTAKSTNNMIKRGHITIVVMAKAKSSLDMFFVCRQLLTEIKTYIQGVSTPFIKCEVVNSIYEDVKVNLTVKFKPWYEKALFLNLLYQDFHNFFHHGY